MSERKVIQKYYPPDFDPAALTRRKGGPKQTGPKFVPVRLMAPFSMCCTRCGEYIAKGRKFNARKQVTDETYLAIKVIRFYIRCTRCPGEITFKTDPRNNDYTCEQGAKRNFEPWRDQDAIEETDEQRLDRLEAAEEGDDVVKDVDPMAELEAKRAEDETERAAQDAVDGMRARNARIERADREGREADNAHRATEEQLRQEREDEEAARKAFQGTDGEKVRRLVESDEEEQRGEEERAQAVAVATAAATTFAPKAKKRKNNFAIPGLVKKKALVG